MARIASDAEKRRHRKDMAFLGKLYVRWYERKMRARELSKDDPNHEIYKQVKGELRRLPQR